MRLARHFLVLVEQAWSFASVGSSSFPEALCG